MKGRDQRGHPKSLGSLAHLHGSRSQWGNEQRRIRRLDRIRGTVGLGVAACGDTPARSAHPAEWDTKGPLETLRVMLLRRHWLEDSDLRQFTPRHADSPSHPVVHPRYGAACCRGAVVRSPGGECTQQKAI